MGQTWAWELPLGIPDPMFLGELALELGMPVGEIGERMSAYELNVFWPIFFQTRHREREREAKRQQGPKGIKTMGGGLQ